MPHPPPDPKGQKVKIQLFQINVMLHIKLKGIRNEQNMIANILPADRPSNVEQNIEQLQIMRVTINNESTTTEPPP